MAETTHAAFRGRVFASICLFSFLVNFGRVVFAPLLEPLMSEFGIGAATAGTIATAAWVGSALPRLPTGYLLTRVRRHQVILGMGAFLVVAATVASIAPSVATVAASALLVGLASGAFFIAANPLVSELYPERVGWALGIRGMSSQVASVSAPLIVSAVLLLGSWRLAFRGLAVAAALVLAGFFLVTRRADLPRAGAEDTDLLAGFRAQWRIVLAGVALIGATGFVWQGVFNFYVSYLAGPKGIPAGTARLLLTVVFAAGIPAWLLSGRLADRVRPLPLLFTVLGAFAVCLLALTAASGLLAVVAASIAIGFVIHGFFPVMDTYVLGSLPDENRASAYSVYSAVMMLLQAPGSVVVGTLVDAGIGYGGVFRAYAVALLCLLAVLVVLYRTGRFPTGERAVGG